MYTVNNQQLKYLLLALSLTLLAVPRAISEVVVIVHPENAAMLDQSALKKIYLGRSMAFPDGGKVLPIDLVEGGIREDFYKTYLRKNQGAVDSYWARMIFTGNGRPPKALGSQEEILKFVASHPQAIGYIDKSLVDKTVKVLVLR